MRPFTFWKYDQFIFVSIQYIICLRSIRKVKFKLHSRKICLRSIRKVKLKLHFRAICLGSIRKVKLKLHFRMTDQKGKYFLDSNSRRLHTKFIPRYSVFTCSSLEQSSKLRVREIIKKARIGKTTIYFFRRRKYKIRL